MGIDYDGMMIIGVDYEELPEEVLTEINSEKNRNVAMDFFSDFMQRD